MNECPKCHYKIDIVQDEPKVYYCRRCEETFERVLEIDVSTNGDSKIMWNFFKPGEVVGLDAELVKKLDVARGWSKIPYVITDGKRTPEANTDPNAAKDSAHLTGHAVDLRCTDNRSLWKILNGLYFAGFKRIGVYFEIFEGKARVTHIHADDDETKDQEVVWLTVEK